MEYGISARGTDFPGIVLRRRGRKVGEERGKRDRRDKGEGDSTSIRQFVKILYIIECSANINPQN